MCVLIVLLLQPLTCAYTLPTLLIIIPAYAAAIDSARLNKPGGGGEDPLQPRLVADPTPIDSQENGPSRANPKPMPAKPPAVTSLHTLELCWNLSARGPEGIDTHAPNNDETVKSDPTVAAQRRNGGAASLISAE